MGLQIISGTPNLFLYQTDNIKKSLEELGKLHPRWVALYNIPKGSTRKESGSNKKKGKGDRGEAVA